MAGYTSNGNGTYSVNYNDERFANVNNEKDTKLNEVTNMYDNMINDSDKYYQAQIDAAKEWSNTQQNIQQQNTDFAIEKINQEKDKAERNYIKEQKGAYADYMKQSNDYGANAEQMAAQGLMGSGYSETSRVAMWNAYQNRYATARQSYNDAVLNYNNSIKEAMLANNEALATIAYEALQKQLELSLQGFQYKNTLLETKLTQQQNVENTYYNRYQDVLGQINNEINNQMTADEAARQQARWEAEQAQQKAQWEQEMALQKEQFAWQKAQASSRSSGGIYGSITDDIKEENTFGKEAQDLLIQSAAYKSMFPLGNKNTIKNKITNDVGQAVQSGKISQYEYDVILDKLGY